MAEPSSKRRKAQENDGEGSDRMSTLPDSVLCHILSFLPTKTCVATMSLVSRRWRHLWEHLQVLDFSDDEFKDFPVFVNAVLAIRRSRDIRKMRLKCAHSLTDTYSVDPWIRAAIGPHLEELHLSLFSSSADDFQAPLSLFTTCTNLVSLSLCGKISVHVQHSSAVRLPSLKTLQLDIGYVDADVDSVDALLSGCPILETLDLTFVSDSLSRVRVPRSLKRLELTDDNDDENDVGAYLEIDAPCLKYLNITQITLGAVGNLQSVVEANLAVLSTGETESVDPLLNLLRALSGTKHLVLRPSTIKWLLRAPVLDFPQFRYLLHLHLIVHYFNSSFLLNVLQKCPMLQALIIRSDTEPSPLQTRGPEPTSVPNCLVSHLTCIDIKGYHGSEDELAFAEYILRNGLVLKTVFIADYWLDLSDKYFVLKRLSDMPRGSAVCQLKFD